jgi:hypothetical protein
MTLQELNDKLTMLYKEYKSNVDEINREYALSNNPYKVGDIFTDHNGSILIEQIKWTTNDFYNEPPCCTFYGVELKKDGTPKKSGTKRRAWQFNDVKSNSNK